MKKKERTPAVMELDQILRDARSEDEAARARAARNLCPCRIGWQVFEEHMDLVARLRKDPSPLVRAQALHVTEDAAVMQSDGLPTHRGEVTNEMLRRKRQSRFLPVDEIALTPQSRRRSSERVS